MLTSGDCPEESFTPSSQHKKPGGHIFLHFSALGFATLFSSPEDPKIHGNGGSLKKTWNLSHMCMRRPVKMKCGLISDRNFLDPHIYNPLSWHTSINRRFSDTRQFRFQLPTDRRYVADRYKRDRKTVATSAHAQSADRLFLSAGAESWRGVLIEIDKPRSRLPNLFDRERFDVTAI